MRIIQPVTLSIPLNKIKKTKSPMAHRTSKHLNTNWNILIHLIHFLTEGFIGFAPTFP